MLIWKFIVDSVRALVLIALLLANRFGLLPDSFYEALIKANND